LSDLDISRTVSRELKEGRINYLGEWIEHRVHRGEWLAGFENHGAATAWLIRNFPLEQRRIHRYGRAVIELTNPIPYSLFTHVLVLGDIIALLPNVPGNQKAHLLRALRSLPPGHHDLVIAAGEFIERIQAPQAVPGLAELLSARLPIPAWILTVNLEKLDDFKFLGTETVKLAKQQGWYPAQKTFVIGHILAAYTSAWALLWLFAKRLAHAKAAISLILAAVASTLTLASPPGRHAPPSLSRPLGVAA